jgi:hypothetical protein
MTQAEAEGRRPTAGDRVRHNRIHSQATAAFTKQFGAELRDLNQELQREQIRVRFGAGLFTVGALEA